MALQNTNVDAIGQVFGSPFVKGALAALTVAAAIVKYIKDSSARRARAKVIADRYLFHGPVFWIVNRAPHLFHLTVAIIVLLTAALEIVILVDQFAWNGAILASLPSAAAAVAAFVSTYFVALFLGALLLYVVFELRGLELTLAWLTGLVPALRNSVEWANAYWQIKADEGERLVLAPSQEQVKAVADDLIDALAKGQRNNRLALRPAGLADDSAANILYFGHVVEEFLSNQGGATIPWTTFYEALGIVAKTPAAPFSTAAIRTFAGPGPFLDILRQANANLPQAAHIPNDAGLEQAVRKALAQLRDHWKSDTRTLAAGILGTSYARVLRAARHFLDKEGMRRQLAKLFILWNLVPDATRPEVFKLPFNVKMFIKYLDGGAIRSSGTRFDYTSEPVQICFESVQRMIVERVLALLEETEDLSRVAWRNAEKQDVEKRGLDWAWWVYYRADQQAYHEARDHVSTQWKQEANQEVVAI